MKHYFDMNINTLLNGSILDPRGPIAAGNAQILINSLSIMLVIVVPTILITILFALWFRESNNKALYRPTWAHSAHTELVVWGIPLLVVFFLSGVIWIGSHKLDPGNPINSNEEYIRVDVVSLDWKWLFIYPDYSIASINDLVIPLNTEISFRLTSGTVMNIFFIPQLGSMIAAMNGMESHLHLKASHEGVYTGLSAQFSGEGFSDMRFTVHVVPAKEFTNWVDGTRKTAIILDEKKYLEIALKRSPAQPTVFGPIDPTLFKMISSRGILADKIE